MQTENIHALSMNTLLGTGIGEEEDLSAISRFNLRALAGSLQKEPEFKFTKLQSWNFSKHAQYKE